MRPRMESMDTLTNEEALQVLSASRSAPTPTGRKLIHDISDNLDAIREGDDHADDAIASEVGAHGSYSFSMHVLTLPPFCVLKNSERENPESGSPRR